MLISLRIRNIALIEELEVPFQRGFQVLSGETGAGKSIVVDAVNLALGGRADRDLIRYGADRAWVEAAFDAADSPAALALLRENEIPCEDQLITLYREISRSGRNICRVCGVTMQVAFLKEVAALLMDVHGQHEQQFLFRGWEVRTKGNPLAHAILRGYVDKFGKSLPNYHYEDLVRLHEEYGKRDLVNPAVVIDANHANSGKKYLEQIRISNDVLYSRHMNPDLEKMVKGLMIESYIEDGNQKIGEGVYGKSITDPCLGWQKTEDLILELAGRVDY